MKNKQIYLEKWQAWAPGISTPEEWYTWARLPYVPAGDAVMPAPSIPAMSRRRCSKLAKISIELALQVTTDTEVDYSIFCSQHGDLSCTVSLLEDIGQGQALSPTQFTQSVHNSAVGLFTIINKLQNNSTFISARNNTFAMALLEAVSWLNQHDSQRVLIVMTDTYFPDFYKNLGISPDNEYGVALILSNVSTHLEQQHVLTEQAYLLAQQNNELAPALSFLAWFLRCPRDKAIS